MSTEKSDIRAMGSALAQRIQAKNPATPKYRRGKIFQSGPGATRTRDLLLRSAGHHASLRQQALILPENRLLIARWR
jgi:hypothetical protein